MSIREKKDRQPGSERKQMARPFADETRLKENGGGLLNFISIDTVIQDLRYAFRTARRSPVFAIVGVLTLALGIGANTAVFSLVDSFLLRPLPILNPGELTVLAYHQKNGALQQPFSIPEFQDIRSLSSNIFSDVICFQNGQDGLTYKGKTEPMLTNFVSGNYFSVLGIQPAAGRFFSADEGNSSSADPLAVLAYSYWQARFGGDPAIIDQQVSINGHSVTVIGVAPAGFRGIESLVDVQAYLPLSMMPVESWVPPDFMTNRTLRNLILAARSKPGVDLKKAQAGLDVVAGNIAERHPDSDAELALHVFPERLARPHPDPSNTVLKVATLFMILAVLVLGLACVNVGNLLLVRATVRAREMALRAALGAGRSRLIRQLLTESALLAVFGAIAGILLGGWAIDSIRSINLNTSLPVLVDLRFDWRVFGFALLVAALTGFLVGIVPALRASRANLNELLREGGRTATGGRHRMPSALVALQIGGSLMLLIVAGLLTRSLQNAQGSDFGFDPSHLLNVTMDPHEMGYTDDQGRDFYKRLLDRVRQLPGVRSAATAGSVPMGYASFTDTVRVPGYDLPAGEPLPIIPDNMVSPGYFDTMRIPLIRGREFTDRDDQHAPNVAIINQSMADVYWHGQDPIGRKFTFADAPPRTAEVIGVVKDSRFQGMAGPIGPQFFAPLAQVYPSLATLQVRTEGDPVLMAGEITALIREMAPAMPVFEVQSMTAAMNTTHGLFIYRFGAVLAAALGVIGLVLAIIGVYGVVSYGASQRTQEISVRMALGARPADIFRMIFGQGIGIVTAGLVFGIAAAIAVARLASNFLVGVNPVDPATYLLACAVLSTVALAACYLPARRAMRIKVTEALRYE